MIRLNAVPPVSAFPWKHTILRCVSVRHISFGIDPVNLHQVSVTGSVYSVYPKEMLVTHLLFCR